MEYLRIKNVDQFQQYKDGRPVKWVKVWVSLLDDYSFNKMPESTQIHLVKIWLYAAKNGGRVENDQSWIERRIEAHSKVDLKQLVAEGWLIPYETVRNRTDSEKVSYTEKRREEKRREEKKGVDTPNCPHLKIIDLYHEILPERPKVLKERWAGSASSTHLKARWDEDKRHQNEDFWRGFFTSVRSNDWRMGRDSWKGVDLHWLVNRANFDKVVQDWANAGR